MNQTGVTNPMNPAPTDVRTASLLFRGGIQALSKLSDYHRYEAFGLEHATAVDGPYLVACNHSFATYDAVLLALAGYEATGRWFHAMADRLFFRVPLIRSVFSTMGFVEGSRSAALSLLNRGEVLGVLPGGMRDALRGSDRKYEFNWEQRFGFVWLSLMSGAPIILAACPRADDIFDVIDTPLSRWAYKRFRVPVPLARGIGPTGIPRPVKLWHLLSEPIYPPVPPSDVTESIVHAHHQTISARMTLLMREALNYPGQP